MLDLCSESSSTQNSDDCTHSSSIEYREDSSSSLRSIWLDLSYPSVSGWLPEVEGSSGKGLIVISKVTENLVTPGAQQASDVSRFMIVVNSKALARSRSSLADETHSALTLVEFIVLLLGNAVRLEDVIAMGRLSGGLLLQAVMSGASRTRVGGRP
jgi:hypothetical protein